MGSDFPDPEMTIISGRYTTISSVESGLPHSIYKFDKSVFHCNSKENCRNRYRCPISSDTSKTSIGLFT